MSLKIPKPKYYPPMPNIKPSKNDYILKPCPFCNNESVFLDIQPLWNGNHGYYGKYKYIIKCQLCGCTNDKFCEEIFNVKLRLYQKVFIRLMSRGKNMTKQYKHYTNITREILDSIDIGDLIKINDWKKPMIVEAVSDNYFLMIQERNGHTYYSVCSKLAWNGIKHNAMVGGMFHCGTDDWIFGTPLCLKYENVYEFDNPYITRLYLKEFEEGKAHISERNGIPIYDLYVKKLHEF